MAKTAKNIHLGYVLINTYKQFFGGGQDNGVFFKFI